MEKKGKEDLELVREWRVIPDLLAPMKNLKVVVLLGPTYAWALTDDLREAYHKAHSRDVKILWGAHPGGMA